MRKISMTRVLRQIERVGAGARQRRIEVAGADGAVERWAVELRCLLGCFFRQVSNLSVAVRFQPA